MKAEGSSREFVRKIHRLLNKLAKDNRVFEEYCMSFFGITRAQGATLLSIPSEKSLRMSELSNIMYVDNTTMTRMIDQLVDKVLVSRTIDDNDRRQVNIALTVTGKKLRKGIAKEFDYFNKETLAQIPEEEREIIIQSLKKLNDVIENRLKICREQLQNRSNNVIEKTVLSS